MQAIMRSSICLTFLLLLFQTALVAAPRAAENKAMGACLKMTVAANDIASFGGQVRQHYRIVFKNLCDSVRVVYWCAEHPSKTLTVNSVCSQRSPNQPQEPAPSRAPNQAPIQAPIQASIAAPLYAVSGQREFQWTFPQGTLIRFVDCDDSTYPTNDFRCSPPGQRKR